MGLGGAHTRGMDQRSSLGEFLQGRRARISPDDVGLVAYGERRRVPGLRREEMALLAGVSAGYYTRLEQGVSLNASAEVLNAIAGALRLSPVERDHLHVLSAQAGRRSKPVPLPREQAAPDLKTLLDAMTDVPAIITSHCNEILAWNRAGHALLAGHLDYGSPADPETRPSLFRLMFLDAHTRDLYRDWDRRARSVVGNLRVKTAMYPGDAGLEALVGELAIGSPEFVAMWAEHPVEACGSDDCEFSHPIAGDFTLTQQRFSIAQHPNQALITYVAAPGSPSSAALTALLLTTTR
jgi:transcriptional regulator with XRE-family HTH domain